LDAFLLNKKRDGEGYREQKLLIDKIRMKLKDYSKLNRAELSCALFFNKLTDADDALIQQSAIRGMHKHEIFDLNHMQNFLPTKDMGECGLIGVWGSFTDRKEYADDIITIKPRPDGDSCHEADERVGMLQPSVLKRERKL